MAEPTKNDETVDYGVFGTASCKGLKVPFSLGIFRNYLHELYQYLAEYSEYCAYGTLAPIQLSWKNGGLSRTR